MTAVVLDYQCGNTRNRLVQRGSFAPVVSGKDNQNDRVTIHPKNSGIIRDEWLAVSRLVGDADTPQVPWKPVVDPVVSP